jgi:ketosteroid isomerase-like protein
MRIRHAIATIALLCTVARVACADPAADAHALGEAFARAVAAGDVEGVLALYADDARAIYPGQGQGARGKAALRTMLERDLPGLRSLPMRQASSDAFALDETHIVNVGRWEVAAGPGRPAMTIRTSEVLVKEGSGWRYLVDHASIGTPPAAARRGRPRGRR